MRKKPWFRHLPALTGNVPRSTGSAPRQGKGAAIKKPKLGMAAAGVGEGCLPSTAAAVATTASAGGCGTHIEGWGGEALSTPEWTTVLLIYMRTQSER